MEKLRFHIRLESQPEGGYTAQCIELPGAVSEGETKTEALRNVKNAILSILDAVKADGKEPRFETSVEELELTA